MRQMQLTLMAVCAMGIATNAQDSQSPRARTMTFEAGTMAGPNQMNFDIVALDPMNLGAVVADLPYSADATTEFTQVLADGNRIERRTTTRLARDSQGRVWREQQGIALGSMVAESAQPIVTINDPKNGVHWMLDANLKVAFRTSMPRTLVADVVNGAPPVVMFGSGVAGTSGQAASWVASAPIDNLQVNPSIDPTSQTFSMAAGVAGGRVDEHLKNETLPPQMVEGQRAEGTRTTLTIPAGAMGNTLPIEVINERWYSPELKIVLVTRRFDPRFGDTVYRVINIDRSEPPADLFRAPTGYKIEDLRARPVKQPQPQQ